ncbi:hypothetical protein QAD02_017701 [Eretmocerus hayati]|uniref:Uncharacterized protein n=1 Tax=Eretmocerus hayati TaxID=131215 RepID=A0ACC2PEB7_9HYME|nr:hypothetical protein QAD02_017701 [Eretmocerus hayati]
MSMKICTCILWWIWTFFGNMTTADPIVGGRRVSKAIRGSANFSSHNYNGIEKFSAWTISCDEGWDTICTLRVQNYSFAPEDKVRERVCHLFLDHEKIYKIENETQIEVFRFGSEKFIVETIEEDWADTDKGKFFINFKIVDMQICRSRTITFDLKRRPKNLEHSHIEFYKENRNIILNPDSVSIIYAFSHESNFTQETFNSTGDLVYGPVGPEHFDIDDDAVIMSDKPIQDININNRERFKVINICNYRYPCHPEIHESNNQALTTSMDSLTRCEKQNATKWSCMTQLVYSNYRFFSIQFEYAPVHIMIHNVYQGNLITMTSKWDPVTFDLAIELTMFSTNGQRFRSVEFTTLSRSVPWFDMLGDLFLNDDDYDICFHLSWGLRDARREFSIKCYSLLDLTQPL